MKMSAAAKQEVVTLSPSASALTPMDMLNQAVERGANIETLDRLMSLQERWEKNHARKEFDAAIAEAKKKIKPVTKNRAGHNGRYADFGSIAATVDPVLSEFGLSYRFRTSQDERIHVTCVLSHRAGHSEENTIAGPPETSGNKNAIQAIGATLTYLQRYSLMQALGLAASSDDDAQAAGPTGPISDEQLETLLKKIADVKANVGRFCEIFNIESPSELPVRRFDEAITKLTEYGKQARK